MASGKVLITGGSAGIGKAVGLALARQGMEVVLLGRDPARGAQAVAQIRAASGNTAVSALACDLADLDSVRRAAAQYRESHGGLDVLINNAGLFLPRRELAPSGLERTFAGLYLGHFLLTRLLLEPLLVARGRLICVTCPPGQAQVHFDDLSLARGYSTLKAQFQAKGGLFMLVRELHRRHAAQGLSANTLLPGLMIKTELLAQMPWYFRVPVQLFGMSPERAAEGYVRLAAAPEMAGVGGRHYTGLKEIPLKGQIADDAACRRMWELGSELAGLPVTSP
jgi:NAD(P)-dependent dehydrogenase (short-subunit alcohol dehydrogenase family)